MPKPITKKQNLSMLLFNLSAKLRMPILMLSMLKENTTIKWPKPKLTIASAAVTAPRSS